MKRLSLILALVAISTFAFGCGKTDTSSPGTSNAPAVDDGQEHSHDHTGKHGGHLIELGHDHAYHAELVDDHEKGTITIYIMDGDLKPLAIKQPSVTLVLTAGDNTQTFELAGATPESSSEFTSSDEKLMGMIDTKDVTGKLRVTINDTPFTGAFDHHEH